MVLHTGFMSGPEYVLKETAIRKIIDFSDFKIFEDANIDTAIYILKKTYDITKLCIESDYSVVEIISIFIDEINEGNYNIDEISDFCFNPDIELNGFLDDNSWKKFCINTINSWIGKVQTVGFNFRDPNNPHIYYKYN